MITYMVLKLIIWTVKAALTIAFLPVILLVKLFEGSGRREKQSSSGWMKAFALLSLMDLMR